MTQLLCTRFQSKPKSLKTSEVRSGLKDMLLGLSSLMPSSQPTWNKGDADIVVAEYFNRLSQEELWKQVDAFNEDSHLALKAIGRRFFKENFAIIRARLESNFQERAPAIGSPLSRSTLERVWNFSYSVEKDVIETSQKQLRVAALTIIANSPVPNDREMLLKYLSTDWAEVDQTMACLRGLLVVGQPNDRAKLDPLLADSPQPVQTTAALVYLALSPNTVVAAKDLLNQATEIRVWAIICHALQSKDPALSPVLESLLNNDSENIRRLVCFYMTQTQSKSGLRKERWTPKLRPVAKLDFSRTAQCEKEQIHETKTQTV